MEKSVSGALNVLFCTQPESTPVRIVRCAMFLLLSTYGLRIDD
jgi:hypothetical protein